MPVSDLRNKYGGSTFDAGVKMQSRTFEQRVAEYDSLDQHFTKCWLDFAITGMYQRPALDTRTRLLVLVGQYTMAGAMAREDTGRAAIAAKSRQRILENYYTAYFGGTRAPITQSRVLSCPKELKMMDESRLAITDSGTDAKRKYEREQDWNRRRRRSRFVLKERPVARGRARDCIASQNHLNVLSCWSLDTHFAGLWVSLATRLYTRGIVDDKTRLLCMVGDCLAMHEETQARAHMRGSLRPAPRCARCWKWL